MGESLEETTSMCRAEGILFLILLRAHSPALKIREVIPRTEHEVLHEELLPFLHDRIARQRRIDLHTAGGTQARPSLPDVQSKAPPLGKAAAAAVAPLALRPLPASDVHVSLPPRPERSRRDRHGERKLKPAAHQALAEKAAAEAARLAEALASGRLPVFAVDLSPPLLARFAAVATAPDDAFRAQLGDVAHEEREYLKTLRMQIAHAVRADDAGGVPSAAAGTEPGAAAPTPGAAPGRALLYSIREGRLVMTT